MIAIPFAPEQFRRLSDLLKLNPREQPSADSILEALQTGAALQGAGLGPRPARRR